MKQAFYGIDVGSISTKGVILDQDHQILAQDYLMTRGNPIQAVKDLTRSLENQLDKKTYQVMGLGTTGSARKLVGAVTGAGIERNEITAHAIGTISLHPDVRTILEIGGQDSKIILIENGVVVDYAMNTLCAAGTGAFLSSQANRLGVAVEDFGQIALGSKNPTPIAARCTVFAESDLVHKAQMGYEKRDIIAGLCKSIVNNYLNNVGRGKTIQSPIVFQGGVSKNQGVQKFFEEALGQKVIVDPVGHLAGAIGIAILAHKLGRHQPFNFEITQLDFTTQGTTCPHCPNHCEIMCVLKEGQLIDAWGNRCPRGALKTL
ncbi:MAG: acyl-CoA dehydratase activase [Tissierellia bacterium]|nr:acyl-CoA dehydratase activase [Tissierellia bacterium]